MDMGFLGDLGDFIGGVAVVGSLLYVGLQVRQSNTLNQAESVRAFVRDYNAFLMQLRDLEFTDIFRRGSTDFASLTRSEQTQVHLVLWYHLMLGWADSMIDPRRTGEFAQFLDTAFASTVSAPGFSQWWDHAKAIVHEISPEYAAQIEAEDAPNLLDGMPWFVPDESELERA